MYIYKLDYWEYKDSKTHNSWSVNDVYFSNFTLIVGKNSAGKTRIINVIKNLARVIKDQKVSFNEAEFKIEFKKKITDKNIYMKYSLVIHNSEVVEENLWVDGQDKLIRNKTKAQLYSNIDKKLITIEPPNNRLALHARRDKKEFDYFETLVNWAETLFPFTFATKPSEIKLIRDDINIEDSFLTGLEVVPTILERLNDNQIAKVIKELNSVGYEIESLKTVRKQIGIPMIQLTEKGIKHPFEQYEASQGMFRAVSLLIMLEYFQKKSQRIAILVDDLCEGLDYERSTNFTKLLFNKVQKSENQFITTTNVEFLMNGIPFKYWNILKRKHGKVKAFNYENSHEIFDELMLTGFSNFNIFASNLSNKFK